MQEAPTDEANLFDRLDHRVGESKVLYYHTYLQFLALFVEQTQKPRYESGFDSPTSLVQSSDELAEYELTLRK